MPEPSPPTCTTVRACTATATHEIIASGKIRGLPAKANVDPVDLFACELHLPIATGFTRNRQERSIVQLPTAQPTLFDTEE